MIFYFSGTGNSYTVAEDMLQENERLISIADALNKSEFDYVCENGENVGFVFPVYFYTVPLIVRDFVQKLTIENADYVYGLITCGGGISQAGAVLKKMLVERNLDLNYVHEVLMPDNSMLFYQIPAVSESKERIGNAKKLICEIKQDIMCRKNNSIGNSTIISDLLGAAYKTSTKTKKFYADEKCIGCGMCEKNCPQQVIKMVDKKPAWTKPSCTKCSACINRCPVQSIQYGKGTLKRNRYVNPEYK